MLPVINPLVIETFARLHGAIAFLDTLDDAIPIVQERELTYLSQLAREGGWEPEEYAAEKLILNHKFRNSIPTVAAYSAIILLYSIVETQMDGFAEHIGQKQASKLRVNDMAGHGVERSALYLKLVLSIDVKTDPVWSQLKDLQKVRNIIAHRGGKCGERRIQQDTVDDLLRRYPHVLEIRKRRGFQDELWISMDLCRDFAETIDGFFERTFKAAGLPNRHMQLDR